jgi:dihydropyrimidinase
MGSPVPFVPEYLRRRSAASVPAWISAESNRQIESAFSDGAPQASAGKPVILKGGDCIFPQRGTLPLDIMIQGGKIISVGEDLRDSGATIAEVKGKYIAPGIIDPHVHLGIFTGFDTEIVTETRSALLNGVTTIGIYLGGQESYLEKLGDLISKIEASSFCDVFVHLVILTRQQLEEIPVYHSRYGITSFKTYMCGIPGLIPEVEDDFLLELMEKVAGLGKGAVLNIHAENHRVVEWATRRLKKQSPHSDSLALWEKSHPGFAEAEAIQRATFLSQKTGARLYFVHLSSGEAAGMARELKSKNKHISFETTSPYLTLHLEEDIDLLSKMAPPIRNKKDQEDLWGALADDTIDTIGSDHTPMSRKEKVSSLNLWDVPPGYPAVGTHLPSLLDRAKKRGFPLRKLIEKMTSSPAELFGLYPAKGSLLPGSDADLVIIDPLLKQEATPQIAASRSDYCLHQGKTLAGWPVAVIKSGRAITPETFDRVKDSFRGRYLGRG